MSAWNRSYFIRPDVQPVVSTSNSWSLHRYRTLWGWNLVSRTFGIKSKPIVIIFFWDYSLIFFIPSLCAAANMVRAWYMDENEDDQRLEHHREPPAFLSLDELYEKTGVEYFKVLWNDQSSFQKVDFGFLFVEQYDDMQQVTPDVNDEQLKTLKLKRGYSYEDEITCSPTCLPNYQEKVYMVRFSDFIPV